LVERERPLPAFSQPTPDFFCLIIGKPIWAAVVFFDQFKKFSNVFLSLSRPMTDSVENGFNITIHIRKYSILRIIAPGVLYMLTTHSHSLHISAQRII
jgi:hypothetical protein